MNQWLNPRIWRSPNADFYRDEPLHTLSVYTDDELRAIRNAGFDGVWLDFNEALVRQDARLGFHQECQAQFVSVPALDRKIQTLETETSQPQKESIQENSL